MRTYILAAATALSLAAATTFAPGADAKTFATPQAGQTVFTPSGPVVVTGHVGRFATTTLPGGTGQGILMDNGNGTNTLIESGGSVAPVLRR